VVVEPSSPAPVSLVLAAQEVQSVRMGTERRSRKAPAGGRARLGRDFWFYFSGQAVSQLGGSFTLFAMPLLVFKLTHSATNLALTTVAEFVPYLLFGLLVGAVMDRFDRKRLMLGSDIAQALVIAVIPVLAIAGSLRVADIYAVTFVQSTLGIIFDCGEFAAIPSLVGEQELVTANARIMATNNAGQILGPVLAGALVAFVPVADLLFVDAATFLVSSGCLVLIRGSFNAATPAGRPAGSAIRALLTDVREGLAYVWSNPVLRSISIMMALINFVATTADSQLVLFARRALHATNSEIGFLYAAGAAGIVAVSLVAGPIRRRVSFAVAALGALVLAGLTTTAMALVGSYPAALVLWAASSGFGMLLNINTVALRQAIVPSQLFGRVVSVAQVLAWSAIPLGSLAGAAAINLSGSVTGVYAVIGVLIAAIALAFAFSPVGHGDRYLAEAAERRVKSVGAGHSPASG
jgi:MFS family permease